MGRRPRPRRASQGAQLDAAYEYINWYTSGWVGGYLNRQGYYSAAMDTAKEFMSDDEWGYWIEGKPAKGDIMAPDGKVMEKAGAVRDGGSFEERMGKVACWNSVMDEDRYMVRSAGTSSSRPKLSKRRLTASATTCTPRRRRARLGRISNARAPMTSRARTARIAAAATSAGDAACRLGARRALSAGGAAGADPRRSSCCCRS